MLKYIFVCTPTNIIPPSQAKFFKKCQFQKIKPEPLSTDLHFLGDDEKRGQ